MLIRLRQNIILLCLLVCLITAGCQNGPTTTDDSSSVPAAPPAQPLPDVAAMIARVTTQDGCRDFSAEMRMTSQDEAGKRDQVDFRIQRKYTAQGALTFVTVLAPREEMDKALLAIERKDEPTQAVSYLSGLRRLTRINSSRQLGFRGARVTVQELLGMELGQYNHSSGERVAVEGQPMIKVDFSEKPDLFLAYPRIVGFFSEHDRKPVRFELFDSRDELQKEVVIEEVKEIQNHWTITSVAINDLQQKLKLKLETHQIDYDQGLSDKIFTEDYLKSFINGMSRKLGLSN